MLVNKDTLAYYLSKSLFSSHHHYHHHHYLRIIIQKFNKETILKKHIPLRYHFPMNYKLEFTIIPETLRTLKNNQKREQFFNMHYTKG